MCDSLLPALAYTLTDGPASFLGSMSLFFPLPWLLWSLVSLERSL